MSISEQANLDDRMEEAKMGQTSVTKNQADSSLVYCRMERCNLALVPMMSLGQKEVELHQLETYFN